MHIHVLIDRIHATNVKLGWAGDARTVGDDVALMHSELSELLDDFRSKRGMTEVYYEPQENLTEKPCGIPIELADLFIRGMDFAHRHDIDLEAAIEEKMAFNATRPFRHGGKAI